MEKFIFNNRYKIYSDGTIWSIRSNKFLKPHIINSGYEIICFCVDYVKVKKLVHRVVAEAFIPNPNNLPEVNHKDRNKLNNTIENLEWVTQRQNTNHRYKSKYPGACFNKQMKKWQTNTRVNGKKKFIGYFNTPEEASNAYISYCTIHNLY